MHIRLKEWARQKKRKFETEHDMVAVRDSYAQAMSRIMPEAVAAERRAAARLEDLSQGQAYLGDSVGLLGIMPSPSGMETIVAHDTRVGTRRDATRIAPRSSSRKKTTGKGGASRDASGTTKSEAAEQARQDTAQTARRLDSDSGSGGYF